MDAIFLTEWDHDYPTDTLEKLWMENRAVVSGLYASRTQPTHPSMVGKEHEGGIAYRAKIPNTSFKTEWTGLGSMLIRKEVFDRLKKPFFDPVDQGIDRDFCLKLKREGIDIWIQPDAKIGHLSSDMLWPKK